MNNYVVFDLETTGLANTSRILEIGAWKVKDGVQVGKFNTLINPKCHIPRDATLINRITDDMVSDALGIEEVLPQFYDFCEGLPFLGHNVSFDYNILVNRGKEVGLDFTLNNTRQGLCTLKISKKLYPDYSHKLGELVKKFNLEVSTTSDRKLHSALYDAYMCKRLYEYMSGYGTHSQLPIFTPRNLGGTR